MHQYNSLGSEKQNRKLSGNFERGKYFYLSKPTKLWDEYGRNTYIYKKYLSYK